MEYMTIPLTFADDKIDNHSVPLETPYGTVCMEVSDKLIYLRNYMDISMPIEKRLLRYNGISFHIKFSFSKTENGNYQPYGMPIICDMNYSWFKKHLREKDEKIIIACITAEFSNWVDKNADMIRTCEIIRMTREIEDYNERIQNSKEKIKSYNQEIKRVNLALKEYQAKNEL